jgi:TonB family protein
MRKRNQVTAILFSLVMISLIPGPASALQKIGGREDVPGTTKLKGTRPTRAPTAPRAKGSGQKKTPGAVALADLTVAVTPSDARVWLNEQEIESREQDGSLRLMGLKPGELKITARKPNYHDYSRTIILEPEQREFVSVALVPLTGYINITPSVSGAAITLTNKETMTSVGRYAERLSGLEVPAGSYQISITRTGYKEVVRDVEVKSAETIYLEPQLELLPVEKPALRRASAMNLQAYSEGKSVVVSLTGASGDATGGPGTIEVSLPDGISGAGAASGALPGVPCQVSFVRLENVGEYSFAEPPAASNGWARVVVRIRPKDSKRPVRFAITWSPVRGPLIDGGGAGTAPLVEDAVPVQKILPSYPPAARASRTAGTVLVKVEIDEQGDVISAKAIEGPNLLRAAAENAARQWKFRPARRDGTPARAIQTLQFNFNPQF